MAVPDVRGTWLTTAEHPDLLVVGPSLGTAVELLWSFAARAMSEHFSVLGWDLPGHGRSPLATAGFTIAELAMAVLQLVEEVRPGSPFRYAGVSVGGAVGLHLALAHRDRVHQVVPICTAARIGDERSWAERAELVRRAGTPVMVAGAAQRWFAAGSVERHPTTTSALLDSLIEADAESYALVCEALAGFDMRADVPDIAVPLLAVAGAEDGVCPPEDLAELASRTQQGRTVICLGCAHLAPAEDPQTVAAHIIRFSEETT